MIKSLLKLFKKKHQHEMTVERYSFETCSGTNHPSRLICKKCGWVDFESGWTNYKKPDYINNNQ